MQWQSLQRTLDLTIKKLKLGGRGVRWHKQCIHVSKCKNDKIKGEKEKERKLKLFFKQKWIIYKNYPHIHTLQFQDSDHLWGIKKENGLGASFNILEGKYGSIIKFAKFGEFCCILETFLQFKNIWLNSKMYVCFNW
jgi:hypothetical protein